MLSSALSQLLERARTRFGLEVDVFDSSLRSLYPEAGSELSRMIDASPAMRRALHDVMMGGRSQQVGEGDRRYRLFPLRSGARRRAGAGVLAIRRAGAAPHVDDAEPWSELARAVVEADLAAGDLVGEERLRSRRLSGVQAYWG